MVKDLFMFAGFNESSQIVWFKIIYSKEPGSLSSIIDFLEKKNAFIMFGHLDNITQKTGEYSVFTELNKDINPDEFASKIKELEVVSEVEYGISKYGMVYSMDFPLNVIGVRELRQGHSQLSTLLKLLTRMHRTQKDFSRCQDLKVEFMQQNISRVF